MIEYVEWPTDAGLLLCVVHIDDEGDVSNVEAWDRHNKRVRLTEEQQDAICRKALGG